MEQRLAHAADPMDEHAAARRQDVTQLLTRFLGALDQAFALPDSQLDAMRSDFLRGIDSLTARGMGFAEILRRLDPERMQGFYLRPGRTFYPLDNGAKQYPLTMRQDQMAMFRVSAELDAPVDPVLLQLALTFTLRRFPHYATRLRRGVFWYYLQPHTARYAVNRDSGAALRAIDVADETQPLFRVLYKGNRVSAELFHILTDGMGGMIFLKSLLAEYCRLQGEDMAEEDPQVLDTAAPPRAGDVANGFLRFRGRERGDRLIGAPAVQIPANRLPGGACRVEEYALSVPELRQTAREADVSVTALMSAVILTAIRKAAAAGKGRYQLQLPVDLRRHFPSDTLRNYSWFATLSLDASDTRAGRELAKALHAQIRAAAASTALMRNVAAAQRAIRWLRYVPLQWKAAFLRTAYRLTGDFFFTSTLSNLGLISLPIPLRTHVRELSAVLGPSPSNPYVFGLASVQDRAILSVTRTAEDTAMLTHLADAARTFGLTMTKKGTTI